MIKVNYKVMNENITKQFAKKRFLILYLMFINGEIIYKDEIMAYFDIGSETFKDDIENLRDFLVIKYSKSKNLYYLDKIKDTISFFLDNT